MAGLDLREWLGKVEQIGKLRKIDGADWNLEIGCLELLNVQREDAPVLLFDNIKGYPSGYRVVSSTTSAPSTLGLTYNLPSDCSNQELVEHFRQKLPAWEKSNSSREFPPKVVKTGPVLENILSGDEVDLFKFPTPKWHELDGGRYIGTGDCVITRDPDTGAVNLATYRIMVQEKRITGLYISPGKHGRIYMEKYHAQGKPCPVAVSVGHHPLQFWGCGGNHDYEFIGAVRGEPVKVIKEEVTGLLIPAESEIVIVGWCPPDKTMVEGPFGEATGYYATKEQLAPIIEVERIYHRNNPIILGAPPGRVCDSSYHHGIVGEVRLQNQLKANGISDVRGTYSLSRGFRVISIKQRYGGHAKRAALIASSDYRGRYVIIVDDDIDPSNPAEVLWAICSRSDPEKDIEIIRGTWSSSLDTMIRKPTKRWVNTRAIIDACKPYDWIDEFQKDIRIDPALASKVKEKWGSILDL